MHTMEIQGGSHDRYPSRFTRWTSEGGLHNWRSDSCLHSADPKALHDGDPSRCTQWRSEVGSEAEIRSWESGDPKPIYTMGIPIRFAQRQFKLGHSMKSRCWFTQWRSEANLHNSDPTLVQTMEIQNSSHGGDPRRVHITEILKRIRPWKSRTVHIVDTQGRFT